MMSDDPADSEASEDAEPIPTPHDAVGPGVDPTAHQGPPGEPAASYRVGRGNPPLQTRFKPGRSGNPRGRPKRSLNLNTILREALSKPVALREHGRKRMMTGLAALVHANLYKGIGGDTRAAQVVLTLLKNANLIQDDSRDGEVTRVVDQDDLAILEAFIRQQATKKDEP